MEDIGRLPGAREKNEPCGHCSEMAVTGLLLPGKNETSHTGLTHGNTPSLFLAIYHSPDRSLKESELTYTLHASIVILTR